MSNRSAKSRKVILAFSIILVVTLYLGVTIITFIFGSEEDRDGSYAEKLFDQSCGISNEQSINGSFLNRTSLHINNNITDDIPEANLTCHGDFINTGDQCKPSCVNPFVNSEIGYLHTLTNVCLGLIAISSLLGGSACIIIAIIGRQYVFTFPTVLTLYQVIALIISGTLTFVSLASSGSLFCSHPEASTTLCSSPTAFCVIYGFFKHFLGLANVSFLLVHILYVLILIKFPIFGKQKLLKKKKTIHIVFVTFVIVTAALGPIVSWATGSYQLTYLPPQICVIRSTVVITYAQLVPFMTQFCVVIVLTLVLSYEVYNAIHPPTSDLKYAANGGSVSAGRQEIKLILLSVFLILYGIVQLATSLYFAITAEDYTRAIANYFQCNLHGNKANCMIEYNGGAFGALYVVGTVTDMAISWALFFYIIKRETVEKIRIFLKKIINCKQENFEKFKDFCCFKKTLEPSV